ncbi:MAG TPA: hypothetical protein VLF19_02895 [Methylomirabilota bacterium]|nr:hypothetical protein [Methylomirabilota bacterium]
MQRGVGRRAPLAPVPDAPPESDPLAAVPPQTLPPDVVLETPLPSGAPLPVADVESEDPVPPETPLPEPDVVPDIVLPVLLPLETPPPGVVLPVREPLGESAGLKSASLRLPVARVEVRLGGVARPRQALHRDRGRGRAERCRTLLQKVYRLAGFCGRGYAARGVPHVAREWRNWQTRRT